MPNYRAGDLVTIRLTEADAYELGCGADAKPTIAVSTIIAYKPIPPPYSKTLSFYNSASNNAMGNNLEYCKRNHQISNDLLWYVTFTINDLLGYVTFTIDASKEPGNRVTVVETAP